MAAQFRQGAPKLGLKDDHQGDGDKNGKSFEEPPDDLKLKQLRQQSEHEDEQPQSNQNPRTLSAAEVEMNVIKHKREEEDLDRRAPMFADERSQILKHIGEWLPSSGALGNEVWDRERETNARRVRGKNW